MLLVASVMKIIVIVMIACSVSILLSQAQTKCHVETDLSVLLSQSDEHLVFFLGDNIQTLDRVLQSNVDGLQRSSISVAGSRIAWTANEIYTTTALYIYDVRTETLTSLDIYDPEWIEPDFIQWVNADEIMIIYKTSKIRIPEWYPGSIINIDTGETDYLYPTYVDHLFEEPGIMSTPLVNITDYASYTLPRFSSNGRYLMLQKANNPRDIFVIDIGKREIVQELDYGIWSYDGEFMAGFDDESNDSIMTIFKVADNSIHDQLMIDGIANRIWIFDETSWSPGGHHIAFRERGQQTDHLSFIDIEQKRVLTSCFVNWESGPFIPFQFSWSSDGRYLAFYGVLETVEDPENGTIYIYDTETNIAYEVFTGDAEIVGWLNLPYIQSRTGAATTACHYPDQFPLAGDYDPAGVLSFTPRHPPITPN